MGSIEALLAAMAVLAFSHLAAAQEFPSRPITLVAPFPAGSTTDTVARSVAEHLSRALKQPVLVENKVGQEGRSPAAPSHGLRPTAILCRSEDRPHSAASALYKSPPYDPVRDFRAIGGVMKVPVLLCVRADFPAEDLAGFPEKRHVRLGAASRCQAARGHARRARCLHADQ